jgi:hypothetical protein
MGASASSGWTIKSIGPSNPPNAPANPYVQGLLEKHKDYVLRARDFQRKQGALKQLRHKAAMRNPDEFYFAMQTSKTKGTCMRVYV